MEKISNKALDKIESKLASIKWVGGLSLVVNSRTIMSREEVKGIQVEKYIFDLGVRNVKGEDVGRLEMVYFYKPISVIKLGLIYVNSNFRNLEESYGKTIMQNLQIFIGGGVGLLSDQTNDMWDSVDGQIVRLNQQYLGDFYEKLGWVRLFPNEDGKSKANKKIFSKKNLPLSKIQEIQECVNLGII